MPLNVGGSHVGNVNLKLNKGNKLVLGAVASLFLIRFA